MCKDLGTITTRQILTICCLSPYCMAFLSTYIISYTTRPTKIIAVFNAIIFHFKLNTENTLIQSRQKNTY